MHDKESRRERVSEPVYVRIATELRAQIESGELSPGELLPSTREITRRYGVAIATATKVLTTLRTEGLVHPVPGVGTIVREPEPAPAPERRPRATVVPRVQNAPLSRDQIVHSAVAVADAEGVASLSMRRVASELGVTSMALYRHVSSKEELLHLMADAVFSERPLPEFVPDWRQTLEIATRREWDIYRCHPWVVGMVSVLRPMLAPATIGHTEWVMSALRREGHSRETAMYAIVALAAYTIGMAGQLDTEQEQETGVSTEQWWREREVELAGLEATGRFPHVFETTDPPDLAAAFEFGLMRLLDGFEAYFGPSAKR
ncbi:TetR/AcrR family transcriptional regulator C-terminal domain-containing protein [Nonomuraea sp. NPDC050310]|uniref:TetR/AcrR family transcriptional regulator C-terminal domain-containing protein n=1 Tax=Nonomuraea sp. NPDC050310 TaxID=3154935 RepID=UPI0033E09C23